MRLITEKESNVRGYCRAWPEIFERGAGSHLLTRSGDRYIDFFSGAGVLNYGHNNPILRDALVKYLEADGIVHGLDMATEAKTDFLRALDEIVLKPRRLDYKVQFPNATGTNAVEAALKLARRVTGRSNVIAFTNGYHGMTLGSLSATGNRDVREAAGVPLAHTTFMPYDQYMGADVDTTGYLRQVLTDGSSGVDMPAAILLETVQGEGGVNVARYPWLRQIERVCREHEILLIVDDIQVGCGRAGTFFSFEQADIRPDIVLLSKALSGFGLPVAAVLLRPELDVWKPGEHNGTFRGNNLAFVTARKTLEHYWQDRTLTREIQVKNMWLRDRLCGLRDEYAQANIRIRGRGLIFGLEFADAEDAHKVARAAFERRLVVETCGADGQVVKLLPSLTIEQDLLALGVEILENSIQEVAVGERAAVAAYGGMR